MMLELLCTMSTQELLSISPSAWSGGKSSQLAPIPSTNYSRAGGGEREREGGIYNEREQEVKEMWATKQLYQPREGGRKP